jgi:hypothetical protein
MRRWKWFAGLTLTLLSGACAHSGPPQGWAVSRTTHVKVYTEAWIEHEFMQEWLELSHAAYQALFPDVKTGTVDAVWLKNEPGGTRFFTPLDDPASGWTLESMPSGGRIGRDGPHRARAPRRAGGGARAASPCARPATRTWPRARWPTSSS